MHEFNFVHSTGTSSGKEAKQFMKAESDKRLVEKAVFLPEERASMITYDETERILQKSFEYIAGLMEFNLINLEFSFHHHLYNEFKDRLKTKFCTGLIIETKFEDLVQQDDSTMNELREVQSQIEGLRESLQLVRNLQRNHK